MFHAQAYNSIQWYEYTYNGMSTHTMVEVYNGRSIHNGVAVQLPRLLNKMTKILKVIMNRFCKILTPKLKNIAGHEMKMSIKIIKCN